jgi:hypothetical protein
VYRIKIPKANQGATKGYNAIDDDDDDDNDKKLNSVV